MTSRTPSKLTLLNCSSNPSLASFPSFLVPPRINMQNENGQNVDMYIPRKCSYTNRLIPAKDHGSVQINVANIDPATGTYTGEFTPYALTGYIRNKSEGDMAFTTLVTEKDAATMSS